MSYCAGAIFTRPPPPIRSAGARISLDAMGVAACDWFKALPADGEMYGNDRWGDCWEIMRRWIIALRRANVAGDFTRPSMQAILSDYTLLAGFNQLTGANDNGTDTSKGMTQWCSTGVRVNDQTLDIPHWLTVDPTDTVSLAKALFAAGPLCAIWRLPMAMQDPSAWTRAPGISSDWTTVWAEHATVFGATDGQGQFVTRTWGMDLPVHPDVLRQFCIHVDVPVDLQPGGWMDTTGFTPSMLDRDGLIADMAMMQAP